MMLGEIFTESSVSVVKTVWQKRGDTITRKDKSRMLAAAEVSPINHAKDDSNGD
jgi:hypothetical protein